MKPDVFIGLNSIKELANLYPNSQFHIWHIPEIDHHHLQRIKSYLGGRIVSQNVYKLGMPDISNIIRVHDNFSKSFHQSESVIIGIGGGSLMDFAKVLRFCVSEPDWLTRYLDIPLEDVPKNSVRQHLVLIPTTAGTGSEVTGTATIWDFQNNKKHSFFGSKVYADVAIIDPELSSGAPWELTRDAGLDALSHALESIWNRNSTNETRSLAIAAIKKICLYLQDLQIDLRNMEARLAMSSAALSAGLAMAQTQTALAHALSYQDTLNNHQSHGYACGTWLPLVWQLTIDSDGNQVVCGYLEQALGDFFDSPSSMALWLKDLGVIAHNPNNITDEICQRIEAVKYSPRGKNFIGFSY